MWDLGWAWDWGWDWGWTVDAKASETAQIDDVTFLEFIGATAGALAGF